MRAPPTSLLQLKVKSNPRTRPSKPVEPHSAQFQHIAGAAQQNATNQSQNLQDASISPLPDAQKDPTSKDVGGIKRRNSIDENEAFSVELVPSGKVAPRKSRRRKTHLKNTVRNIANAAALGGAAGTGTGNALKSILPGARRGVRGALAAGDAGGSTQDQNAAASDQLPTKQAADAGVPSASVQGAHGSQQLSLGKPTQVRHEEIPDEILDFADAQRHMKQMRRRRFRAAFRAHGFYILPARPLAGVAKLAACMAVEEKPAVANGPSAPLLLELKAGECDKKSYEFGQAEPTHFACGER